MVATVNEAYRLDINVQEGGGPEQDVAVYGWNVQEAVIVNKTTDVSGDVTTTNVEVAQYDDDGVSPSTTVRTPLKIRALKYGLFFREQELVPTGRASTTFFLSTNTTITQTTQATVDAYTGISFNDVSELITLNNTGGTPVNNVDRLYDRVQSRYSKAATPPQFDYLNVVGSPDKLNYTYDYEITLNGSFTFDGQGRSFARSNTGATLSTINGGLFQDITTDFLLLQTGAAGLTYTDVNVTDTLTFNVNGTHTWSGGTIDTVALGGGATAVTLNLLNGASLTNAAPPGITVNNTVNVRVTVTTTAGVPIQNAQVILEAAAGGDLAVGTDILFGTTNASGVIETNTFNYTNPQPVTGRARKSTGSPLYKTGDIVGQTITVNGLQTSVALILDE